MNLFKNVKGTQFTSKCYIMMIVYIVMVIVVFDVCV